MTAKIGRLRRRAKRIARMKNPLRAFRWQVRQAFEQASPMFSQVGMALTAFSAAVAAMFATPSVVAALTARSRTLDQEPPP
jgi:hypothetical protein